MKEPYFNSSNYLADSYHKNHEADLYYENSNLEFENYHKVPDDQFAPLEEAVFDYDELQSLKRFYEIEMLAAESRAMVEMELLKNKLAMLKSSQSAITPGPHIKNGAIVGYVVKAGQGFTQIADDINRNYRHYLGNRRLWWYEIANHPKNRKYTNGAEFERGYWNKWDRGHYKLNMNPGDYVHIPRISKPMVSLIDPPIGVTDTVTLPILSENYEDIIDKWSLDFDGWELLERWRGKSKRMYWQGNSPYMSGKKKTREMTYWESEADQDFINNLADYWGASHSGAQNYNTVTRYKGADSSYISIKSTIPIMLDENNLPTIEEQLKMWNEMKNIKAKLELARKILGDSLVHQQMNSQHKGNRVEKLLIEDKKTRRGRDLSQSEYNKLNELQKFIFENE